MSNQSNLTVDGIQLQPTSVPRKLASALPGLRELAHRKGLKIHHLGAGYPHPEVTDPSSYLAGSEQWVTHLRNLEGVNDSMELPSVVKDAYTYTDTLGPISPRESFAQVYGRDWDIQFQPENLIPTVGATGGINLICSVFERLGVPLAYITDAPTYAGFISRCTLDQNTQIYSISLDQEGGHPDELRDQVRKARKDGFLCPFYYTVPDGHNPAGFSFSPQRKRELLQVAEEENLLIVEDAPYVYINYAEDPKSNKPLVSMNPNQTVHLFTGSKIGLPGPRIGFAYTEATIGSHQDGEIQLTDLLIGESSGSILFQNPMALLAFEGNLREADGEVRDSLWPVAREKLTIYGENREILLKGLDERLGSYRELFEWTVPEAGFFSAFTVNKPDVKIDDSFTNHLVETYGVVVVPMYGFYPEDALARTSSSGFNQIRLSFCFTESQGQHRRDDLEEATAAFCQAMKAEFVS